MLGKPIENVAKYLARNCIRLYIIICILRGTTKKLRNGTLQEITTHPIWPKTPRRLSWYSALCTACPSHKGIWKTREILFISSSILSHRIFSHIASHLSLTTSLMEKMMLVRCNCPANHSSGRIQTWVFWLQIRHIAHYSPVTFHIEIHFRFYLFCNSWVKVTYIKETTRRQCKSKAVLEVSGDIHQW